MPRAHRPMVAIEAELRSMERRSRIGAQVKAARQRRRWTQAELGRRASLGRMVVARIELGKTRLDVEALDRLAIALGVTLTVELGRDPKMDVADAGHLAIQELILKVTRPTGLIRRFELPTKPNEPWRSADIAIGSPTQRAAADVECWNTMGDIGAAARSSNRKVDELKQLALAAWGPEARASLCWVVRDTKRNREIVAKYPGVFEDKFPGSSSAWVAALTRGAPIPQKAGLVWCDVKATRLFAWRQPRPARRTTGSGS